MGTREVVAIPLHVKFSENATEALAAGREFLTSRAVLNALSLFLLEGRARRPMPARYWIAKRARSTVGVALQSPLDNPLVLSLMPSSAVRALVQHIYQSGVHLPAVIGEARIAALFAAEWAQGSKSPVTATRVSRLYEARSVRRGPTVAGRFRFAVASDQALLAAWARAFAKEVGEPTTDADEIVARMIAEKSLYVWEDGVPISMAYCSPPAAGVALVSLVYTPPEHRRRGLGAACVAAITRAVLSEGQRCVLFANLADPTANALYRRIGYQRVAEFMTFELGHK